MQIEWPQGWTAHLQRQA